MKSSMLTTIACGALSMIGTSATAEPKGNAWGYHAGRICDATSSWLGDHGGLPYWMAFEEADYESREECVDAHVEWLKAGNEFPDWAE